MSKKYALKRFFKRLGLLITIIALCSSVLYFSLRCLDDSVSVIKQAQILSNSSTIIIDAGHGGEDGGCTSVTGTLEKDINLNIAQNLRDMFSVLGFNVVMTRDSDKSIHDSGINGTGEQKLSDMKNRLDILNSSDNAICVSIHQNLFAEPQYSGAQIFYSAHKMANAEFAQVVQDKFREMLQPENKREIKECGDSLYLCCNCKNPMVMVECGFLSNPEEAKLLDTEEYQQKVAFTILYSVLSYEISR